ncbi:AbrB/MazE/SpoVT family DNA-binding domain-containing protein [Heyndrickxia sporothermodurans]|uniref:AbrB/MazE/SpoVT family DNA-binding domain-containing protein n=1 Tax=Heyndrickxia sporothermodurans TaxID=46224 RepID=UPI002DB60A7A|nr:AbrB/MazE/SpoVT family DNA-binding domain-containing protein [Heyndrickxia sporothermodurans]MEB6550214.1 AbrB/MazE/SpoVT family DNA-binding domain-containing protein [Heyndrickxia sporothermodurans]
MFKRKVDYSGRITLPSELCTKFDLKKNDMVEVSHNQTHILIRKFQPEYVCVITGKVTDKGKMIGNAFISNEGLNLIKEALKKGNI